MQCFARPCVSVLAIKIVCKGLEPSHVQCSFPDYHGPISDTTFEPSSSDWLCTYAPTGCFGSSQPTNRNVYQPANNSRNGINGVFVIDHI